MSFNGLLSNSLQHTVRRMRIHASKAVCISFSFLGAPDPDFPQILSKLHIPVVKSTKIYNSVPNALQSITFFVPGFTDILLFKEVGIWISNPRSGPGLASVPERSKYTEQRQIWHGISKVRYCEYFRYGTLLFPQQNSQPDTSASTFVYNEPLQKII
jgi:hypothetical protein